MYEKRPTHIERDPHVWKEICMYEKRATIYENRPTTQTHMCGKRLTYLKTDLYVSKETYNAGPHICKETHVCEKKPIDWLLH